MKKIVVAPFAFILFLSGCGVIEKSSVQIANNQKQSNVKQSNGNINPKDSTEGQQDQNNENQSGSESNQSIESDLSSKTNKSETDENNGGKSSHAVASTDTVPVVANPTAMDVMVNKSNALPEGYRPSDLVRPNVKFVFGSQKLDKALMRSEAATALEKMFQSAASQGISLFAASGFRSYERQSELFEQEIKQVGREKAELAVARPGTSEHQTGLSMDITGPSVKYTLTQGFENKEEGKWLAEHAYEFGFILRYPKEKESITKYKFEPWHYRYVGTKIATEIYNKGITLEEYFGKVKGV